MLSGGEAWKRRVIRQQLEAAKKRTYRDPWHIFVRAICPKWASCNLYPNGCKKCLDKWYEFSEENIKQELEID